jgi:hypothetical protein
VAGYTPGAALGPITADLGTITLGEVDADGIAWTLGTLEGWDSADVRTQYTERQADHGAWAGQAYYQARVITVGGTITAMDQAGLDGALEQLRSAVSLDDTLLTVHETISRQVTVRSSGRLLISRPSDRIATWSALLTAADPRRYSTVLQHTSTGLPVASGGISLPLVLPLVLTASTASGQLTLTNEGTIGTRPTFQITGPVTAPALVVQYADGSTGQLAYSDTVGAGDVLVIDAAERTVTLNGLVSRRRYLSGAWPEIPPASTVTVQWSASTYDPAAQLDGYCRSAWK